ncbi:MAG: hypothetical protein J3R72DRAFT_420665 [Linnemannia gamsii]|nr:MAG: hypothetical protein J3R72DRAFT_420665 [Linnemannia gamsii]
MKILNLTTTLTIALSCILLPSSAQPHSPQQQPSSTKTTNGDIELRRKVAQHDGAFSSGVNHYYEELLGDHNFTIHARSLEATILSVDDVGRFCVGLAFNPNRVQIFQDQTSCDGDDWKTLFVFSAFKKKDYSISRRPICVGHNNDPDRSMLFAGRSECAVDEWNTAFSFFESGGDLDQSIEDSRSFESMVVWEAFEPHRMMLYPHYDGEKNGWREASSLTYKSRWRPATYAEVKMLVPHIATHSLLHKRTDIHPPYDPATFRCAQALIVLWNYSQVSSSMPRTLRGDIDPQFNIDSRRHGFTHLTSMAYLRIQENKYDHVAAVDVVVDGLVRASASIPYNTNLLVSGVQLALEESLRTGRPVPVIPHKDHERGDFLIGMIEEAIVVFGGSAVFRL